MIDVTKEEFTAEIKRIAQGLDGWSCKVTPSELSYSKKGRVPNV